MDRFGLSFDTGDNTITGEEERSDIDSGLECSSSIITEIEEDRCIFSFVFLENSHDILTRVVVKREQLNNKDIADEFV